MESMLIAAKTYDREQTSEKVRTKLRMRSEKGLHNGGVVPFAFKALEGTVELVPDPKRVSVLEQMFKIYIERRSDFAVRDWLKAHRIPSPRGGIDWQVSTIANLLANRRYIAEIEINRENKGIEGLKDEDAYRVVEAPHAPLIPINLFDEAQAIRREKLKESPNRVERPRSYSVSQSGRINLLQGSILCGAC